MLGHELDRRFGPSHLERAVDAPFLACLLVVHHIADLFKFDLEQVDNLLDLNLAFGLNHLWNLLLKLQFPTNPFLMGFWGFGVLAWIWHGFGRDLA